MRFHDIFKILCQSTTFRKVNEVTFLGSRLHLFYNMTYLHVLACLHVYLCTLFFMYFVQFIFFIPCVFFTVEHLHLEHFNNNLRTELVMFKVIFERSLLFYFHFIKIVK